MPASEFSSDLESFVSPDLALISRPGLAYNLLHLNDHLLLFIMKTLIEFDSDKDAMHALMS